MATVANNDLVSGLSGRLGASLVFRTLRGKTFVTTPARKPDKRKETTAQRNTRTNFKEATQWARQILLNPEKKTYYSKRAKALKLPNAYTAALTDYMRKPKLNVSIQKDERLQGVVNKKGFELTKVEVVIRQPEGELVRTAKLKGTNWLFTLTKEEAANARIRVTDIASRVIEIIPNVFI